MFGTIIPIMLQGPTSWKVGTKCWQNSQGFWEKKHKALMFSQPSNCNSSFTPVLTFQLRTLQRCQTGLYHAHRLLSTHPLLSREARERVKDQPLTLQWSPSLYSSPQHLSLDLYILSLSPILQFRIHHSPCMLSKCLRKSISPCSGSLTAPRPASSSHHLYLIRDLRTKCDPGTCKREARHVRTVGDKAWKKALPLNPLLFNSPRPRQDTRRPDFPRFLQETEVAGKCGPSIRDIDYQLPAPLLPE